MAARAWLAMNDTGQFISARTTRIVILILSAGAVVAFARVVMLVMGGQ
jgi:hypothetical protein